MEVTGPSRALQLHIAIAHFAQGGAQMQCLGSAAIRAQFPVSTTRSGEPQMVRLGRRQLHRATVCPVRSSQIQQWKAAMQELFMPGAAKAWPRNLQVAFGQLCYSRRLPKQFVNAQNSFHLQSDKQNAVCQELFVCSDSQRTHKGYEEY